ncbi:MAG: YeeE/YedE thiosulfate transporter family protein [Saprospiraceae bacterium]
MIEWLSQPWPWWVAGPMIGLMVPLLLIIGNKAFGISSSLKHICAACLPAKIPFFQYNWRAESWNLFFAFGILAGAWIASTYLQNPLASSINPVTIADLRAEGVQQFEGLLPRDIFSWDSLLTLRGLLFTVFGGLMIGFGTRYAGGCTSGHAIMGLSNLQLPSLIATIAFMLGGFAMTHLLLPYLIAL